METSPTKEYNLLINYLIQKKSTNYFISVKNRSQITKTIKATKWEECCCDDVNLSPTGLEVCLIRKREIDHISTHDFAKHYRKYFARNIFEYFHDIIIPPNMILGYIFSKEEPFEVGYFSFPQGKGKESHFKFYDRCILPLFDECGLKCAHTVFAVMYSQRQSNSPIELLAYRNVANWWGAMEFEYFSMEIKCCCGEIFSSNEKSRWIPKDCICSQQAKKCILMENYYDGKTGIGPCLRCHCCWGERGCWMDVPMIAKCFEY